MLKKIFSSLGGDPVKKLINSYSEEIAQINGLESHYEDMSQDQLKAETSRFRQRLKSGETLDDILPEAFALVREASKRTIGLRHYDIQLIGGMLLHSGYVAEMRTGEGKTLVATLPIYLNALTGKGVHLITVNDYLARRDARWMAPIFDLLGMSVGVLQMGSRTEGGQKAFLVDLEKEAQQEDQHQLQMVHRKQAYLADITYGTNSEFGFDYLRDNMRMSMSQRVQRGHYFAIIDEVDNVLIDEARTPLIISGPSFDDAETYVEMAQVVKKLNPEDYELNEKDRAISLTEIGEVHVEEIMGQALRDPERPEDITPEQARLLGFLEQALRAQFLFKRNKDYIVQSGQVIIVDEFTGRMMPGRRWSDGLHQAVEAKEGVRVQPENITHATITIQNYFRMYEKLAGMTGTAMTEEEEFGKIYDLEAVALPSNVEYMAALEEAPIKAHTAEDEYSYEYTYYSLNDDPENRPYLWKRKDYPDVVFRTEDAKLRALVKEVIHYHIIGRPILLGTTSVEKSEQISNRLDGKMIRLLAQTLLLRHKWLEANNRVEDGRVIMALSFLNEPLEDLNNSQLSNLARELGISKSPSTEENIQALLEIINLKPEDADRLREVLQRGIPHNVLNARKHTEESQIIADAGKLGAVTIATNMAGRGVDIKLGGEISEELISDINRVLKRSGIEDPYDLTLEEKQQALANVSEEDMGIYIEQVQDFIASMEGMKKVKELGGLHVIGSERHEARRIDNQLRGRAARQGDPGSSRFYLSMEDDLMRLFGGQQMDAMMQRIGMDEQMPMEMRMVSRVIEGAQTRVEGANFDSREHLLEYDDVLNSQRNSIYNQRDRIFTKQDLSDDILEMLETEINQRVPAAMELEGEEWKLLAWLEQIQPTITIEKEHFPSFTYKLLLDELKSQPIETKEQTISAISRIAEKSLEAQKQHMLAGAATLINVHNDHLDTQIDERMEGAETFFDSLRYADETDTRSGRELLDELTGLVRLPLRFSNSEQKLLRDDPRQASELVESQIENALTTQALIRLIGALDRRLPESLGINPTDIVDEDWENIETLILNRVEEIYQKRAERFLSDNQTGSIIPQLESYLEGKPMPPSDSTLLEALSGITQERVIAFDNRTHKRINIRKPRFSYLNYAAKLVEGETAEVMTEKVTSHLLEAYETNIRLWGHTIFKQIADQMQLARLPKVAVEIAASRLGNEDIYQYKDKFLNQLPEPMQEAVIYGLGAKEINEIYRNLILRVISELWIDYLTKMEALRVSIRLEAYGQRDPLVAYKTNASQMFQELFADMRMSVVSKMFSYRPKNLTANVQQTPTPQPAAKLQESSASQPEEKPSNDNGSTQKQKKEASSSSKRRRRRRK